MATFSIRTLKEHLKSLSKEEVEAEVLKLYKKIPKVQEYYKMELGQDTTETVNAYKAKLTKEYMPSRGFGQARSGVARRIINDFKKICVFNYDLIDLLLHRVELAVDYTNSYGDIDEPFYNSAISYYREALQLIQKNNFYDKFRDRCEAILRETEDIGWGFYDELCFSYSEFFQDDENEE